MAGTGVGWGVSGGGAQLGAGVVGSRVGDGVRMILCVGSNVGVGVTGVPVPLGGTGTGVVGGIVGIGVVHGVGSRVG